MSDFEPLLLHAQKIMKNERTNELSLLSSIRKIVMLVRCSVWRAICSPLHRCHRHRRRRRRSFYLKRIMYGITPDGILSQYHKKYIRFKIYNLWRQTNCDFDLYFEIQSLLLLCLSL